MLWLLLSVALVVVIYLYVLKPLKYWKNKNVLQKSPTEILLYFVGGFVQKKNIAEYVEDLYKEFSNSRYSGGYVLGSSGIILRDTELIKQITVKDFDHFTDHRSFVPEDYDPVFNNHLFALKGEKWRNMRSTLSPTFTSSKMKAMFVLMSQCAEDFVNHFVKESKSKTATIDVIEVLTRFTNDVIATTAFGVKCDSLKDRENEFYVMGKKLTATFVGFWVKVKLILFSMAPQFATMLRLKLFDPKMSQFFFNLVTSTIRTREEKNIVRPDMIHLMMETRKGSVKEEQTSNLPEAGFATVEEHIKATNSKTPLTDVDITAQALVFFFAGFDGMSRSIAFTMHEIAVNSNVHERLQQEVDETLESCNGKITYEALLKMKYLDMVISESLRLWPNALMVDRVCVKPYTIKPETADEHPVTLVKGDVCFIPIFAIHRDPKFFPEPERFDPERFNEENKRNIKPYTYIPFGTGPRNCIASRFALLEIKILIFHLLSKFELVPVEKTQIPLKLSRRDLNLNAENGFWLGFKARSNKLS